MPLRIEAQEAAAANHRGINGEPHTGRRLETEIQIRNAQIPAGFRKGHRRSDANAFDNRVDRADRHAHAGRYFSLQASFPCLQAKVDGGHSEHAADRQTDRQRCIQAGTAAQGQPSFARPCKTKIEIRPCSVGR